MTMDLCLIKLKMKTLQENDTYTVDLLSSLIIKYVSYLKMNDTFNNCQKKINLHFKEKPSTPLN